MGFATSSFGQRVHTLSILARPSPKEAGSKNVHPHMESPPVQAINGNFGGVVSVSHSNLGLSSHRLSVLISRANHALHEPQPSAVPRNLIQRCFFNQVKGPYILVYKVRAQAWNACLHCFAGLQPYFSIAVPWLDVTFKQLASKTPRASIPDICIVSRPGMFLDS
eukprot:1158924-Pelagomonas_calceolata.AAC.7